MKATLRKHHPVPLTRVNFTGGFWAERVETNRRVTLPIQYEQCRKTGRLDAWKLNWKPGDPNPPHIFWDSDVAKWIEAAACSLAARPDRKLERLVDGVVHLMEKAQQPDGYLNTHFIAVEPEKRWANLRDCHELYCAGHLMEAAVAYYRATGKRGFLDVMCRYADCIGTVFGPEHGRKRGYCGHEEIELALVKLYRATGVRRYLQLAEFFINERGRTPYYFDQEAIARGEDPAHFWGKTYAYCQAHAPVREQAEVVGHAVRAMYLYCGMADVAAETGDRALLAACKRLWDHLVQKRLFVTGGVGCAASNEGFTFDYDLPNESGYAETCASIGLVFWAHRMLHLDPDSRYADVMERALYNGVLSGVSQDGRRFFYGNPLASFPGMDGNGNYAGEDYRYRRSEWFGCACCPPNIARLVASLGEYIYSEGKSEVRVNLYACSRGAFVLNGRSVTLEQKTDYPWKEEVLLTVAPDQPITFTLALRIPGWCRAPRVKINGRSLRIATVTQKGYARLCREWRKGDTVALTLPMPVERIEANPGVRQDCGRVALQRGPLVYCLEEADNGKDLNDMALMRHAKLSARFDPDVLGGAVTITGRAVRRESRGWAGELYRPARSGTKVTRVRAIPYFLWANREEGEMLVWMREA